MNINTNYKELIDNIIQLKCSFLHSVGGTNGNCPTEITYCDINEAKKILLKNNWNISEYKKNEKYYRYITAYIHPEITDDLFNTLNFTITSSTGEIGFNNGIKFIVCNEIPVIFESSALSNDLYLTYFVYNDQISLNTVIELRSTKYRV